MSEQENQNNEVEQNEVSKVSEQAKSDLRAARDLFSSLGIKVDMSFLEFCGRNNIEPAELEIFNFANYLKLSLITSPSKNEDSARAVRNRWHDAGLDAPLLHDFLFEAVRTSGFFTTPKGLEIVQALQEEKPEDMSRFIRAMGHMYNPEGRMILQLISQSTGQ